MEGRDDLSDGAECRRGGETRYLLRHLRWLGKCWCLASGEIWRGRLGGRCEDQIAQEGVSDDSCLRLVREETERGQGADEPRVDYSTAPFEGYAYLDICTHDDRDVR